MISYWRFFSTDNPIPDLFALTSLSSMNSVFRRVPLPEFCFSHKTVVTEEVLWTAAQNLSILETFFITAKPINLSVQFSHSVVSNSLWPDGLQHARLPYPSPTPRACSNSRSLSWWCHPTLPSSVVPFSSCLQSFPASESFLIIRLFASGGQSIGASASATVLPINIQDWFPKYIASYVFLTKSLTEPQNSLSVKSR